MKTYHKTNSGQTLIEFALLLPLLILLTLVTLDLGRAAYYYSAVFNAAREGARYGTVHPGDDSGICSRAQSTAVGLNLVCPGDVTINLIENPAIDYIDVTVDYRFQPVTPLIAGIITTDARCTDGPCIPMSSTARMQIEGVSN